MADENRCPQCGALHAEGARAGLCLRCLMLNVLEEQTAFAAEETSVAEPGATGSGQSLEGTEPVPALLWNRPPRGTLAPSRIRLWRRAIQQRVPPI